MMLGCRSGLSKQRGRVVCSTEEFSEKDYSKGLSITANIIVITGNAITVHRDILIYK